MAMTIGNVDHVAFLCPATIHIRLARRAKRMPVGITQTICIIPASAPKIRMVAVSKHHGDSAGQASLAIVGTAAMRDVWPRSASTFRKQYGEHIWQCEYGLVAMTSA